MQTTGDLTVYLFCVCGFSYWILGGLCSRDASDHGAGSDGGDGGDEVPRRRDSGIALRSAGIFAGVRHINSFVFMSVSD